MENMPGGVTDRPQAEARNTRANAELFWGLARGVGQNSSGSDFLSHARLWLDEE